MSIIGFARSPLRRISCAVLAAAALHAQEQLGDAEGTLQREQMWRAPTAEDWQKPVLIEFERSWEDALAVAQETKQPILICVNMDGEIASEHYAGIRYRQPEVAKLYEDYVCVIASVYRHTPRDHDEHGNRILCPRFGSVTCGEHIAIEPVLYEKFFEGTRVAPRHIMIELDGSESYDVYYAWDTASVFSQIRTGIAERGIEPEPIARGDRSIVERVASRANEDRVAVEEAYREGDAELKRALLEAANAHPDAAPVGLLRLAMNGFDPELQALARDALAKVDSTNAVDLINDALRVPMAQGDRAALVAALGRIGEHSPKARTLAVVHRGLGARSAAVDPGGWAGAGASYAPAPSWSDLEARVDEAPAETAAQKLARAETWLQMAVNPESASALGDDLRRRMRFTKLLLQDALRGAREAEELGAAGWRVDAVIALASAQLGDTETAHVRAIEAAGRIPPGTGDWIAISTLALFAEARREAITAAVLAKQSWPPEWLADLDAAFSVIAQHPLGTDRQIASHYDFVKWLGAGARAREILDAGLERFPTSWVLHDRLRGRILEEQGVGGLERTYEAMLAEPDAPPDLEWVAGYTSIVAAEFHRRARDREAARAAYDRAIAHYADLIGERKGVNDGADHYIALALAGRARLAYEAGDLERALADLLASFDRAPRAAASQDGLNISPMDTARVLRARFEADGLTEPLAKLDEALAALREIDPALLELPAYERDPAGSQRGRRGPRRRGR